jgi:hypothetical protein
MPQILNLHTDEPHQSSIIGDYRRIISRIRDPDRLQRLHHEVAIELLFRSSAPATRANPDLSAATARDLRWILDEIFRQVVLILSQLDASRRQVRYVNRYLDRGAENSSSFF